jgi:DNA-binding NarL/FixJ family response regulator
MDSPKTQAAGKIMPGGPAEKKRILVVDAFPMLRHGVITYLNCQPDMIVCGEADSIPSARARLDECRPRLLVIGLRLGTGDSLEFVKALKAQNPRLLILVYSAFEEAIFAERALRAGANGYLMKKEAKEELLTAIRDVLRGDIYVSKDLGLRAFQKSLETQPQTRLSGRSDRVDSLSDREMHIFQLLGSGLTSTQKIAHALKLSVKTIESHRDNIRRKLGLNSSRDLVDRAARYIEENFLPPSAVGKKKVVRFPAA